MVSVMDHKSSCTADLAAEGGARAWDRCWRDDDSKGPWYHGFSVVL